MVFTSQMRCQSALLASSPPPMAMPAFEQNTSLPMALYKARREMTIGTIEVTAGFLLTWRSDAEDLCRRYR